MSSSWHNNEAMTLTNPREKNKKSAQNVNNQDLIEIK